MVQTMVFLITLGALPITNVVVMLALLYFCGKKLFFADTRG